MQANRTAPAGRTPDTSGLANTPGCASTRAPGRVKESSTNDAGPEVSIADAAGGPEVCSAQADPEEGDAHTSGADAGHRRELSKAEEAARLKLEESSKRRRLDHASTGCEVVWQNFDQRNNTWYDFNPDAGAKVEETYLAGDSSARIWIKGSEYDVTFEDMTQKNLSSSGRSRHVRRYHRAPAELAPMWQPFIYVLRVHVGYANAETMPYLSSSPVGARVESLADCYAQLLRNDRPLPLPRWRGVHGDAHAALAAASVARFRVRALDSRPVVLRCRVEEDELKAELDAALERAGREPTAPPSALPQELAADGDLFSWVRRANDSASRLQRLSQACATLAHCVGTGRVPGAPEVHCLQKLIDGTKLLIGRDAVESPECSLTFVVEGKKTVLEVATKLCKSGRKVAIVSAASAYHLGGGLLTGGRHALEEALCMQSTLYFSLAKAAELAENQGWGWYGFGLRGLRDRPIHIPERGCVFSPSVEVFRHGTDRGYEARAETVCLAAVLSVAMPNRNRAVTFSPVDYRSSDELQALLVAKFQAVAAGAAEAGAEVLVVPDVGCGVFRNDPRQVGRALGEVLQNFGGHFQEVVLVGQRAFTDGVQEVTSQGWTMV